MPAPFRRLDVAQFAEIIRLFDFKRKITSFHVHHTWIPRRSQFKGRATIEAMDRVHRLERGFSDIAQHITLDPDGFIWTGRSWNASPASAIGFNGSSKAGPFMMEMVGNFDKKEEPFDGAQAANAYQIVATVLQRFGLDADAIRFHNEMSSKSCPGSSISKNDFVAKVKEALTALPRLAPTTDDERERNLDVAESLAGLIEPLERQVATRAADADAELPEDEENYREYLARITAEAEDEGAGSRAPQCPTLTQLNELVPHVVNLRRGQFSEDDLFISNKGTVDAIFAGLEAQVSDATVPKPLKILFWAHGGLVSQRSALCKAHRDLWWWKKNGIYPIFFVWQTSLGTAFGDIIRRSQESRGISDVWDRFIEGVVRHIGGVAAWDSMKLSAAESSAAGGGARYVAEKLQAFMGAHGANVELHAVGHSAGANFHSHFLPVSKVPYQSLQLLAPALRIDEYLARLDGLLGKKVLNPRIYTMRDQFERDDTCTPFYRKSLLYLIHRGLEPKRDEPLLGLERSLTGNPLVAERWGIRPGPNTVGQVIFSKSAGSTAIAHGCFDDDIPTMDSVATVIRGSAPQPSYKGADGGKCKKNSVFEEPSDVPRELAMFLSPAAGSPPLSPPLMLGRAAAALSAANVYRGNGRRRALCVGINTYPTAPLRGCVSDAELWARTLATLGFESPALLVDGAATRQSILDTLGRLLDTSTPGDVVVFQFSGHGTEVRDLDGDELSDKDQALCPYDFAEGRLLIDDDVAELFTRIPAGVGLTCFLDNCHSGTGTRFAVGRADTRSASGDLPRFVVADAQIESRHEAFRRTIGVVSRSRGTRGPDTMREVVFSACRPEELAWESNGQGDFTRNAVALLSKGVALTNEQLQNQLTSNFTPPGRQHPMLDCAPAANAASLFGFGMAASSLTATPQPWGPLAGRPGTVELATSLRELARIIETRG